MANITTTLTTEQFIKAFGDNEYVRDFSAEAVEYILGYIESGQEVKGRSVEWKGYFMDASEVSSKNLVNDNKYQLSDKPELILESVSYMDDASDELIEKIESNEDLSASALLASLSDEIEALGDYERVVANLIADNEGWHELKNGNFIIIN